jgi:glycosyltransferase involved in cell wall biosynthesis
VQRPHHLSPAKATARVIFFAKNFGGPGISNIGLGVTNQNNITVLRREGYLAEIWSGQTYQEVDHQIQASEDHALAYRNTVKVSHVIINSPSWLTANQIETLAHKYPHIEFVLQNHTGCAYLQIDRNSDESGILANRKIIDLQRAMSNVRVSGNNSRFTEWLKTTYRCPCLYLPNLYDPASFVDAYPRLRDIGHMIRIGSFGAPRPWKNQLTAAMAAYQLARELGVNLELYVNTRRDYEKLLFQSRLDLFSGEKDAKLIDVPWEPWPQFRRTCAHMHLLLQPSFDETFNVVTADGIAAGVPSVVSPAIEWAPDRWKANPCDPGDLVRVALYLLNDYNAVEQGRNALKNYVRIGLEYWRDLLGR